MIYKLTNSIRDLQKKKIAPVISEIKLKTPRDGNLIKKRKPVELAVKMASLEVAGISVVTESEHFGGSMELLKNVAEAVNKPILHKDFITTAKQIEKSKKLGSSAVLLIANQMDNSSLVKLHEFAHELDLETVVEVHTEEELRRVISLELDLDILGINNRDITVLETDNSNVSVTETIVQNVRGDFIVLSESSLKTSNDVRRALQSGADGVLIGTAVMQASDVKSFLKELIETII